MSKIGVVGAAGVVGSALVYGFEKLGHQVLKHDLVLKPPTSLGDLLDAETIYICVPTPSREDGSCNTTIVEQVVSDLFGLGYQGIVAIKSTVTPGTTRRLQDSYPGGERKICFVPEFLRERAALVDFIENHDLLVVGTKDQEVFRRIRSQHGKYPKQVVQLSPTEAELTKYFNNVYNATLVTFANSFYEVCKSVGADYMSVKNAVVNRNHITDIYLDANENFRGFSGPCLVKDSKTIARLVKEKGLNVEFFQMLLTENSKYKATVLPGMRTQ